VLDLLAHGRAVPESCQKKPRFIFSVRPAMMLSSVDMPLNSATFWKVRAMPCAPPRAGASSRRVLPLKVMRALLRVVEAVDDVEHRGLAGAVRADDGADLALADVEGDVGDRLHAAEAQRDVVDLSSTSPLRSVGPRGERRAALIPPPPAMRRLRGAGGHGPSCRASSRVAEMRPCGRPRRSPRCDDVASVEPS
jgi:hypothetical protein